MLPPRLDRVEGHTFLPALLPEDAIIVDLGANTGRFSAQMTAKYACRCFAVEPSPDIFKQIPSVPRLQKFNLAVVAQDGPLTFNVSDNSECSSVFAENLGTTVQKIQVEGIRLSSFLKRIAVDRIDFLKMDIEGAEFDVLQGLTDDELQQIGQASIEFHVGVGGRTREDVRNAVRRFQKAGFAGARMSMTTYADYLFVNRRLQGASSLDLLSLRTFKRAAVYAGRVYSRYGRKGS